MNWAQFKDPVSHMCLAGTVVASWSLTQDVAGLYSNDKDEAFKYFPNKVTNSINFSHLETTEF